MPAIIGMTIIGGATFGILSIVQGVTHANIRQSLFEQHKNRQIETTRSLAEHIGSDLNAISSKLESLTYAIQTEKGDLSSFQVRQLIQEYYDKIKSLLLIIFFY
jgi:uncharacterized membrane protein